jgi:hypothetical protein
VIAQSRSAFLRPARPATVHSPRRTARHGGNAPTSCITARAQEPPRRPW